MGFLRLTVLVTIELQMNINTRKKIICLYGSNYLYSIEGA